VLSFEREIESLRDLLGAKFTDALIARERRTIFSIYPEVRIAAWAGALLLASAAGLVLKNNLDRIGPLGLAMLIAVAAAACYAWVARRGSETNIVDDYVLLLGALLVSGDVAFIETQWKVLGANWERHFLLLAVLHGIAAYLYRSRLVLSLSVAALAAWMGIERAGLGLAPIGQDPIAFGLRAFACSTVLLLWRLVDGRLAEGRQPEFGPVLEHFAANLALAGGLALTTTDSSRWVGGLLTLAIATAVALRGFHTRSESFVLYAFVYAVIAVDIVILEAIGFGVEELAFLVVLASMVVAIATLFAIHARFRRMRS
jgi:translation elongation factor EF-1beta